MEEVVGHNSVDQLEPVVEATDMLMAGTSCMDSLPWPCGGPDSYALFIVAEDTGIQEVPAIMEKKKFDEYSGEHVVSVDLQKWLAGHAHQASTLLTHPLAASAVDDRKLLLEIE